jgi:hypothetical protein
MDRIPFYIADSLGTTVFEEKCVGAFGVVALKSAEAG